MTARIIVDFMETPLGRMILGATDDGLCLLEFVDEDSPPLSTENLKKRFNSPFIRGSHPILTVAREELNKYFQKELKCFSVPLDLRGTEFQKQVWGELLKIPYGTTETYSAIATRLGNPGAVRGVGRANGSNNVAIVVPCHRVVGADGTLVGYAGGLSRKRALLEIEDAPIVRKDLLRPSEKSRRKASLTQWIESS